MVNARVDLPSAQRAVEAAGYTVQSIEPAKGDWPHDKYRVTVIGQDITDPTAFNASFHADFGQVWAGRRIEPIFGGEISLEREAAIYDVARWTNIPAPAVKAVRPDGHQPFLLEEILKGRPLKEQIQALPKDQREAAYLAAVHKVGELFACAHGLEYDYYGDVLGRDADAIDNAVESYTQRLRDIIDKNLARNPHEKAFDKNELGKVRAYTQQQLEVVEKEIKKVVSTDGPRFILANLHRGNVHLDDKGNIVGVGQFSFAQAGLPAAEFYNAFFQFADADVAPTKRVQDSMLGGYRQAGREFDLVSPMNKAVMDLLTLNHFLYATTVYTLRENDPMRNRWGKRFKEEILFPLIDEGKVNHDAFSAIINEKWK